MIMPRAICLTSDSIMDPIVVQQYDKDSRTVQLTVYETPGVLYDLTEKSADVLYRVNGVNSPAYEARIVGENAVEFTIPGKIAKKEGNCVVQVRFYRGEVLLHSQLIPLIVRFSLTDGPGDEEDPTPLFKELLNEAKKAIDAANEAAGRAPYIGENGHWYIWDGQMGEYVDSTNPSMPNPTFEVRTGEAGTDVQISQGGTPEAPIIILTIPRGDTGTVDGVDYFAGSPSALGTASPGEANGVARGDHVHPMPTAEQVGARHKDWMPTAEQVGALEKTGKAQDSWRLNGISYTKYEPLLSINLSKFQGGTVSKSISGNSSASVEINFPTAMGKSPKIAIATAVTTRPDKIFAGVLSVESGTKMTVTMYNALTETSTCWFYWAAFWE